MESMKQFYSSGPMATLVAIVSIVIGGALAAPRPADIPFKMTMIDNGASETVAVADINSDGRLDIISGESWYEAPTWKKHHFRDLPYTEGYIDNFSDLPLDVDGDGWVDITSVQYFSRKIVWYRNPGKSGGPWKETVVHSGYRVEYAVLADIDNDGTANEMVAVEYGAGQAWYEVKGGEWVRHEISSDPTHDHGIGVGDINKDGRNDILTERGWYEAPPDPRAGKWVFHPDWEAANPPITASAVLQVGVLPGEKQSAQPRAPANTPLGPPPVARASFLYVLDVNGDGRNDVITASAHDYGVFWFEQCADGKWTRHMIDAAWSQAHASLFVDLNGDGKPDFVTGKRFLTHGDPGEREPLGLYWYEYRPYAPLPGSGMALNSTSVEWIRHVIDYGGRVGAGVQMAAADLYGRGHLDLIVAGKSGLILFENPTPATSKP
jgi:hypothetical protein